MKRGILVLLALVLAISAFAGGSQEKSTSKKPVKVIYCADTMSPAVENLFKRFTADTGYPVDMEVLPGGNDYNTLVPARFISSDVPDLCFFWGSQNEQSMLNPAENILDLTDWLAKNVKDKLIPESLLRAMAYAGRNYHLPVSGIVVRGFFYNKDVLQKAGVALPKSWDDFLKNVAPKIKAAGFTPVYGMGLDRWGMDFHMENYVADQFATTDIQDRLNKGQANLYDTQFLESLQMIKKLQDAGYFQDNVMTGTYDGAVAAISDGTTFMTGLSSPVGGRIPAAAQDKVSAFCLSKEGNRAYIALPQGMFVPKKAKNMDGARAYLDWFIKPENIAKYYGELKVSPPYQGVKVDMNLTSAGFKSFVDAEPAMDIRLKAFYGQAGNYAAQVLSGEKTPEEALAEMNATYIQNAKAQGLPVKEK